MSEGNNPPPKLLKYIYHKIAEVVKQNFFILGLDFLKLCG
nr:MAG TPA: hypothetical protein [Caudoviricetes sp.]